ncbi:MucBP domain-containing protein [Furfurilactobacillus rossiae]|uniref:MucBP domain-containing protein n=1 Tax=Furfurilactobacillus rossiae TaxID=231049 RepID=UPI0009DB2336|nr:MucBP domain-containing protein [Furfurilactobacillus rossiae]QFR65617.1 hypothetical protein LR814_00115 [Furfurilactobacillus rossiae]QFR68011.1 hypothetical protein LR814_13305 [Furfurilactobacillus rossiae]QLE61005.1 Adhesion exoprotein [Furfurilactobacillus rossiae]
MSNDRKPYTVANGDSVVIGVKAIFDTRDLNGASSLGMVYNLPAGFQLTKITNPLTNKDWDNTDNTPISSIDYLQNGVWHQATAMTDQNDLDSYNLSDIPVGTPQIRLNFTDAKRLRSNCPISFVGKFINAQNGITYSSLDHYEVVDSSHNGRKYNIPLDNTVQSDGVAANAHKFTIQDQTIVPDVPVLGAQDALVALNNSTVVNNDFDPIMLYANNPLGYSKGRYVFAIIPASVQVDSSVYVHDGETGKERLIYANVISAQGESQIGTEDQIQVVTPQYSDSYRDSLKPHLVKLSDGRQFLYLVDDSDGFGRTANDTMLAYRFGLNFHGMQVSEKNFHVIYGVGTQDGNWVNGSTNAGRGYNETNLTSEIQGILGAGSARVLEKDNLVTIGHNELVNSRFEIAGSADEDQHGDWHYTDATSGNAVVQPDGDVRMRITTSTDGTVPITNGSLVMIMPSVGDTAINDGTVGRNSQYSEYVKNKDVAVSLNGKMLNPQQYRLSFSDSLDPQRFNNNGQAIGSGDWQSDFINFDSATKKGTRAFKIEFEDVTLRPGDKLNLQFVGVVPTQNDGDIAPNKTAYASISLYGNEGQGADAYNVESTKVAVKISYLGVHARDLVLNQGENWLVDDSFDGATTPDKQNLSLDSVDDAGQAVVKSSNNVDTSKAGDYQVQFTNGNKQANGQVIVVPRFQVHFLQSGTNMVLHVPVQIGGKAADGSYVKVGDAYDYQPLSIDGYTLAVAGETVKGNFAANSQDVTIYYLTNYTAVPETPDGKPIPGTKGNTGVGIPGEPVDDKLVPDIPGYTLTVVPNVPNTPGNAPVIYKANPQHLSVHYVDQLGRTIHSDGVINGETNGMYDASASRLTLPGYTFRSISQGTLTGKFLVDGTGTLTTSDVTLVYNTNYTVVPVLPSGAEIPNVPHHTGSGRPGDPIDSALIPNLPGYTADKTVINIPDQPGSVKVVYRADAQMIHIHYVDGSGHVLRDEVVLAGLTDGEYDASGTIYPISGYMFDHLGEGSGALRGMFTVDAEGHLVTKDVVLVYRKVPAVKTDITSAAPCAKLPVEGKLTSERPVAQAAPVRAVITNNNVDETAELPATGVDNKGQQIDILAGMGILTAMSVLVWRKRTESAE